MNISNNLIKIIVYFDYSKSVLVKEILEIDNSFIAFRCILRYSIGQAFSINPCSYNNGFSSGGNTSTSGFLELGNNLLFLRTRFCLLHHI